MGATAWEVAAHLHILPGCFLHSALNWESENLGLLFGDAMSSPRMAKYSSSMQTMVKVLYANNRENFVHKQWGKLFTQTIRKVLYANP